jgi:hypothetical protein
MTNWKFLEKSLAILPPVCYTKNVEREESKMIVTYEFLWKEKWTKEEAVFETKEQADIFMSILRNNESYKNLKEVEEDNKGE